MAKPDELENQDPKPDLSRRAALKRLAALAVGVVAGSKIVEQAQNAASYSSSRYVSTEGSYVNTVYADNKYVNRGPTYRDHVSYYTSYNSHGTPPPPK